ncbi:MAG TPA: hypothetical protein VFU15_17165 [Bacteroidia bacterium]|nr:hypothetical protein [Bacteroidia bacterium]
MEISINSEDLFRFAEDEFPEEPGKPVIDALLRFSRSFETRPSSMTGRIESIAN